MKTVEKWIEEDIKPMDAFIKEKGWGVMNYDLFPREKYAPTWINRHKFTAPVDGTVIYQKIVNSFKEKIIDIKGQSYSLRDLYQQEDKFFAHEKYLVMGIFLTVYDCHTVRLPTTGYIKSDDLPCLMTNNLPMVGLENDIIKNQRINFDNLDYLWRNERKIVNVYDPYFKFDYDMMLISDRVVNTIFMYDDYTVTMQNSPVGKILYGSQVELVIPLNNDEYTIESLIPNDGKMYHVEGGKDKILELKWVKK